MSNRSDSADVKNILSKALENIIFGSEPHDISRGRKVEILNEVLLSLKTFGGRVNPTGKESAMKRAAATLAANTARDHEGLPNPELEELSYIPAPELEHSVIRVAIDALGISPGVSGGVEVYMKTLVRALLKNPQFGPIIVCLPQHFEHYRSIFGESVGYCVPKTRRVKKDFYKYWLQSLEDDELFSRPYLEVLPYSFRQLCRISGARILHSPIQVFSFFDSELPSVLNLHDLQHLHLPENFTQGDLIARDKLYGQSAAQATTIVASSKFVADDIARHIPETESKIDMIPVTWNPDLEVDMNEEKVRQIGKSYSLPENYFFFPGQFWRHKNHVSLIKAFALTRNKNPGLDLCLVLTGYRGHTGWPLAAKAIAEEGVESKVLCLDYVPIADLPAIYKLAIACIMPSLFEASSYPVIEAQRMRCPSACSNVTSLPELMAGGCGLLFNPTDVEDIAHAMHSLCNDASLRLSIIENAYRRVVAENSMEAYSSSICNLYRRILS